MDNAMVWPNGVKCAVVLTFDFDAESLWLANDPRHRELPATLSRGGGGHGISRRDRDSCCRPQWPWANKTSKRGVVSSSILNGRRVE